MLKQIYSTENLAKVIRKKHIVAWELWNNNSQKRKKLEELVLAIANNNYKLNENLNCQMFNGKLAYFPACAEDFCAIKLADYFIRRIYKVQQADRRKIIKQLKIMLTDGLPYGMIKLDISDFYESIDFGKIISQIQDEMIIGHETIFILQSVLAQIGDTTGLPRGLGISASLSEIFMRSIDREIRKIEGIFFYVRYVDDIIIIYDCKYDITSLISNILHDNHLSENEGKRKNIVISETRSNEHYFDYLGYNFKIQEGKRSNEITVKIAERKINKQKTRIASTFIHYSKTHDFSMLKRRLRFLSGLVLLNDDGRGRLYAGNSYNYSEISENTYLSELDQYLYSILSGSGRLGRKIERLLTSGQKNELMRISFRQGYNKKFHFFYSRSQAADIKKAWGK